MSSLGPDESRLPALAVLGRFSLAAWRASWVGAVTDAALTVVAGIVPVADLWAARGLVNAIAFAVGQAHGGADSLPLLLPLIPWVAAIVMLAIVDHVASALQWSLAGYMKPIISMQLEQSLLEAGAGTCQGP